MEGKMLHCDFQKYESVKSQSFSKTMLKATRAVNLAGTRDWYLADTEGWNFADIRSVDGWNFFQRLEI